MKNITVPNSIVRSKVSPALKALQAILSELSHDYIKITHKTLGKFIKEKRVAIDTKLSELTTVQTLMAGASKSFTIISSDILMSPVLSLHAKGIYLMIKSFATYPGFVISKDFFYSKSKMSYKCFDKAWQELKKANLLSMSQHRTYTGKFIYTYQLTELETHLEAPTEVSDVKQPATKITSTEITALADAANKHKKECCKKANNTTTKNTPGWKEQKYDSGYIRQKHNYTQREYSDEFLNSLFTDLTSPKKVETSKPRNMCNYTQREYDDEFYDNLFLDLTKSI